MNFHMFKMDLEKTEEPEIIILRIIREVREFQENIYFCFTDYAKVFDLWITTNWKIPKEMGIPDHLTCLLRNLYAGQEAMVRIEHGGRGWEDLGEWVEACKISCMKRVASPGSMHDTG